MTDAVDAAVRAAEASMDRQAWDEAWAALEPHRDQLEKSPPFAWAWLGVLSLSKADVAPHVDALQRLGRAWPQYPKIVTGAAELLLSTVDGRTGDEPVLDDDVTGPVLDFLQPCVELVEKEVDRDPGLAAKLFNTLGNAARLAGPRHDAIAESAFVRALELEPDNSWRRFDFGLLRKNRRQFEQGVQIYTRCLADLGNDASVLWNLGICATGCGRGDVAADAWCRLGMDVSLGPDGLPHVRQLGFAAVRLRFDDGAVRFEDVWIRRISPCHGEVQNPPLIDVGADVADLLLHDGASIGVTHRDGVEVLRFPSLGRLLRSPP